GIRVFHVTGVQTCALPIYLRRQLSDWQVDESWFAEARPEAKFMHCLPVRRNVAVSDALLDGPRSAVLREAYNRMPAQMAVLHRQIGRAAWRGTGELVGRSR